MDAEGRAELGRRLAEGDPSVLADVLRHHGPVLMAQLAARFRRSLDHNDLEDVLAIALNELWQSRSRFDPAAGTLYRWFRKIAMNAALSEIRRRSRRVNPVDCPLDLLTGVPPVHDHQPDGVASRALPEAVRRLIEQLPRGYRLVIEADIRFFPDPAPSELLADDLGIDARSVPVYRARARKHIRDGLIRLGLWPPAQES